METLTDKYSHIKGWGIDANPENDPTYPMKNWNGADHDRLNYEHPSRQSENVEILMSIERPSLPAVFGTSTPPTGLSGQLRRHAFKYSEGSAKHWMTLILADRVNMVEGMIEDIKAGIFPNVVKERGWTAEWKYNKKGLTKNVVAGIAVTLMAAGILYALSDSKKQVEVSS